MDYPITQLIGRDVLPQLYEIPEPPKELYLRGNLPLPHLTLLSVVGSRNYSDYGKQVVEYLLGGLAGYPIAVVSGLALGIDALAHRAALNASLYTLAVPGSGIDDHVIYPRVHQGLAHAILEAGGGLMSEFEPTFTATQWSFPRRNRIMVGLSRAVLLIEAQEKSGTLITARLAADYNRDLLVVPGNIFSENSRGAHQFLKLGATPVTTPEDILEALHIPVDTPHERTRIYTDDETAVLALLREPCDHDTLIRTLPFSREVTLALLMRMELDGLITEHNGVFFVTR